MATKTITSLTKTSPIFKKVYIAIFLGVVGASSFATAEDERGRLPDGRAYRTDREGNQLVDYIAELELENESLKRQVSGLQYDVEQKQAKLEQTGGCAVPQPQPQKKEVITCPSCDCSTAVSEEREKLQEEHQSKVRLLQNQLAQVQAQLQEASYERAQNETEAKQLEGETASLREKRLALEKQKQQESDEIENIEAAVRVLRDEREDLEGERELLSTGVLALRQENERLQKDRDALQTARAKNLSTEREDPQAVRAAYNAEPRSNQSGARDAALIALRGKISTNLNQIQGLISARDRMYQEYVNNNPVVAFKPAAPESSKGRSIQDIRADAEDAQTVRELSLLIREANEMRSKIEFDMGMMERMKRLR